jgi:hypothetical protein
MSHIYAVVHHPHSLSLAQSAGQFARYKLAYSNLHIGVTLNGSEVGGQPIDPVVRLAKEGIRMKVCDSELRTQEAHVNVNMSMHCVEGLPCGVQNVGHVLAKVEPSSPRSETGPRRGIQTNKLDTAPRGAPSLPSSHTDLHVVAQSNLSSGHF